MKSLLLILFSLTSAAAYMHAQRSREPVKYVMTFPTLVKPSKIFNFSLVLFEHEELILPASFVARVTAGQGETVLAEQMFTQNSYGLQEHLFNNFTGEGGGVPSNVSQGVEVVVDFISSGLQREDMLGHVRPLKDKYVFIQTDKAMYRPGETIYFRAVFLNRRLMPLTGVVDVAIENPLGRVVQKWVNERLDRGVFGSYFTVPYHMSFGTWKVMFSNGVIYPEAEEKTFSVPKYMVKFEFRNDSYWLYNSSSDDHYTGFVRAKYAFGRPVQGKATIRLESTGGCNYEYDQENLHYYYSGAARQSLNYTKLECSTELAGTGYSDDGEFELEGLNGVISAVRNNGSAVWTTCTLQLEVNVTDELTGEVINGTDSIVLHREPYLIKVHDSVRKTLKASVPFAMRMQVSTPDERPVGAGEEVNFEVYYWPVSNNPIYDVPCRSAYNFNPSNPSVRQPNISTTLVTDENGIVTFEVTLLESIGTVVFKASLKTLPAVELCHLREASQSLSHQSLSIAIDKPLRYSIPKVGDLLSFNITTSFEASYVYFMLSQNGQTFLYRKLETALPSSGNSTTFTIEIELPEEATPRCAAAAWTVENTASEVLADAVEFKVDGLVKQFVSASFAPSVVQPGGQTLLTVRTSEPNALIALFLIDENSEFPNSGNDISLDDVVTTVGGGISPVIVRHPNSGWCPVWADSSTAERVFTGINMTIKTNARIRSVSDYSQYDDAYYFYDYYEEDPEADTLMNTEMAKILQEKADLAKGNRFVRSAVADVLLYNTEEFNLTGAFRVMIAVPDLVTTWSLSAFAVGTEYGFGALTSPVEVSVVPIIFTPTAEPSKLSQPSTDESTDGYRHTSHTTVPTDASEPSFITTPTLSNLANLSGPSPSFSEPLSLTTLHLSVTTSFNVTTTTPEQHVASQTAAHQTTTDRTLHSASKTSDVRHGVNLTSPNPKVSTSAAMTTELSDTSQVAVTTFASTTSQFINSVTGESQGPLSSESPFPEIASVSSVTSGLQLDSLTSSIPTASDSTTHSHLVASPSHKSPTAHEEASTVSDENQRSSTAPGQKPDQTTTNPPPSLRTLSSLSTAMSPKLTVTSNNATTTAVSKNPTGRTNMESRTPSSEPLALTSQVTFKQSSSEKTTSDVPMEWSSRLLLDITQTASSTLVTGNEDTSASVRLETSTADFEMSSRHSESHAQSRPPLETLKSSSFPTEAVTSSRIVSTGVDTLRATNLLPGDNTEKIVGGSTSTSTASPVSREAINSSQQSSTATPAKISTRLNVALALNESFSNKSSEAFASAYNKTIPFTEDVDTSAGYIHMFHLTVVVVTTTFALLLDLPSASLFE